MKKILFLLLVTIASYGQTYQNPTFGTVKTKTAPTVTTTPHIGTVETDGTISKITPENLPLSTATTNALELETTVSAGAVSDFVLTNNGNGTVNIGDGIAYLRATNNPYATIIKYPISAVTNLALTDNANNYVLVDYNGGSPTITVTTNASTINTQTNSLAYVIARVGNDLEYISLVGQNVDPNAKIRIRFLNQEGIRRASGAILGFSNRNLTLTSSVLFSGLIRLNGAAFNTASPDTFTLLYNNGSAWTRTTSQTQVNNTQYNVSGTLTTMPNNTFRTDYVYLLPNNPSKLYVVLGTTTYGTLDLAKTAPRPSSLPVELQVLGLEVGRLFIEKNSATIADTQSSFDVIFEGGSVPYHNSLSGLQGGAAGQYNHLTDAQVSLVNGSEQTSNKATDFSTVNNTLYPSVQAVKNFISPYNGQTWGVLGDSFGQLGIYQPSLLSKLGITTITDAQGGACITGGTEHAEGDALVRKSLVSRIDAMLTNSITGIIIQGGSNDFHYKTPLGYYGVTDTLTYYGALNYICDKIAKHPTKIKAVFITPTFRPDSQHPSGSSGAANWEAMKPYITAIRLMANRYSFQVVDEFASGINYDNTDVYTSDGIHPDNTAGSELYNNYLISNINTGSLTVPTIDLSASYENDPTFRRTIYWNKHGADLQDDAAIVVTNGVDADLRIKTVSSGVGNLYNSIGTGKPGVNLALQETQGKVLVGTNISNGDEKLQVDDRIRVASTTKTAILAFGVDDSYIRSTSVGTNRDAAFQSQDGTHNVLSGLLPNTGASVGSWAVYNGGIRMEINISGIVKIPNLSGSGIRTVVADASGNLSTDSTVYAPLASPTLTGTPTAPTAAPGSTGTQVANLDFVLANSNANGLLEYNSSNRTIWNNGAGNISFNASFGENTLASITSGGNNSGYGAYSLTGITSTGGNSAFGVSAGRYIANKSTILTGAVSSTFIGAATSALAAGGTNETVIGYDATGYGSNTITLGNTAVTSTYLRGIIVHTTGYTVATLPTGVTGATAYVTDALAPTYMATAVGGGTVVTPVFYNGTNWVCH